jgi:hypothetical protein
MSLTLMASRLALSIQYGVAMAYAWRDFKHGVLPLVIHSVTMLAAGAAYLGVSASDSASSAKGYLCWDSFTSPSGALRHQRRILPGMYTLLRKKQWQLC